MGITFLIVGGVFIAILAINLIEDGIFGPIVFFGGILMVIAGIGWLFTVMPDNCKKSEQETPAVVEEEQLLEPKSTDIQTTSECEHSELCKVEKIQANSLCVAAGCWIDKNSIETVGQQGSW